MKETARAFGRDLPISTKQSVEVCNFIRNRTVEKAKEILNQTINMKRPVPFSKKSTAHKTGIGPGRFPVKTCREILKILNAAEANAQHSGLSGDLKITRLCAQKAAQSWRFGRKRRRRMKRTHIEVVVEEVKKGEVQKKSKVVKKQKKVKK